MGIITLSLVAGEHPHISSIMADFLVVKSPSSYNAILGHLVLNRLRAVMSTHHLKMKFPIAMRVGEVRGEQVLDQECYRRELKPTKMGIQMMELTIGWEVSSYTLLGYSRRKERP